jgi:predicted nucleic acid-binding protein
MAEKVQQIQLKNNIIILSPITFYETLRGLFAVNAKRQIESFNVLSNTFVQGDFEKNDWLKAAELYAFCIQSGHPMGDPDLLQAAFCLRNGYTRVTHTTNHFSYLENLSLEDWVGSDET